MTYAQTRKGKAQRGHSLSFNIARMLLLLCSSTLFQVFLVTVAELINTTCGINKLNLTCVERVRCVRDFKLVQRILNTINNYGFFCVSG